MKQTFKLSSQRIITPLFFAVLIAALFAVTSKPTLGLSLDNNSSQNSRYDTQSQDDPPLLEQPRPAIPIALPEANLTAEEAQLVSLINQERSHTGLEKLKVDTFLVNLAREKSRDMVRHNYFGHNSERLGTVYDQFKRRGISGQALNNLFIAENLAGAPDCLLAYRQMLSSPMHRSNIMNTHFTKIGIGVAKGGPFGMMITEIFVH